MTKKKDIEILLEKYFEGTTSGQEEQILRTYFTGSEVSEDLAVYQPIFSYLDAEIKNCSTAKPHPRYISLKRFAWSAVAAIFLLMLGFTAYYRFNNTTGDGSYVIINGEKFSDVRLAQQQAQKAFEDVSFSKDEITDNLIPEDMKEGLE